MRAIDRDLIRGGHYGQRSRVPRKQAEHMAAPTNAASEDSPCQPGAVHTWPICMDRPRVASRKWCLEVVGLALLYPALQRNVCVPGHHGYPRALDLIRVSAPKAIRAT